MASADAESSVLNVGFGRERLSRQIARRSRTAEPTDESPSTAIEASLAAHLLKWLNDGHQDGEGQQGVVHQNTETRRMLPQCFELAFQNELQSTIATFRQTL